MSFKAKYPSIEDLRKKAKQRIPKFAFEYLDGGCNANINITKNTSDIRKIELSPQYLNNSNEVSLKTNLFGHTYDYPFGIAPIGLQGMIWPKSAEILAKASLKHNIPFILSTVTTSSIEKIAEITNGKFWFQLYNPIKNDIRIDIINRVKNAGSQVLVILCDVPTFGYRPCDIRNGLSMPPKINPSNIIQMLSKPKWLFKTLTNGIPNFQTLKPYMKNVSSIKKLGQFMDNTFSGKLNEEKIKHLRDLWKGKLVLKGVTNEEDVKKAIKLGLDGIIVSNHGGRQLDNGESSIKALMKISQKFKKDINIMMDSGIRSGADIACSLACGSEFVFLGRSFMYGVSAMGKEGADHSIYILKRQLQQVMEQLSCPKTNQLNNYLA